MFAILFILKGRKELGNCMCLFGADIDRICSTIKAIFNIFYLTDSLKNTLLRYILIFLKRFHLNLKKNKQKKKTTTTTKQQQQHYNAKINFFCERVHCSQGHFFFFFFFFLYMSASHIKFVIFPASKIFKNKE